MIALPLHPDTNRCLAHGFRAGERCPRADNCARHVTIRHDNNLAPAVHRCCPTESFLLHIPLEGFPPKDEENAACL